MESFLKSLPADTPDEERAYLEKLYNSMPAELREIVDSAAAIDTASPDTVKKSIRLIDHTSLKDDALPMTGAERAEDIAQLCRKAADHEGFHTAAVCVYPNHIETARKALAGYDVKLAAVNNFPHGNLSMEEAVANAAKSISLGAEEIDTVIDYAALKAGDAGPAGEKLEALSHLCKDSGVKLKIILKASIYEECESLHEAALIAIRSGADFVKTCTGKTPLAGHGTGRPDASTLLTAAIVMKAVADSGEKVGVKISGGVKTPVDCEQMRYLADTILGPDYFSNPDLFRFGASSLLNALHPEAATPPPKNMPQGPKPGGY